MACVLQLQSYVCREWAVEKQVPASLAAIVDWGPGMGQLPPGGARRHPSGMPEACKRLWRLMALAKGGGRRQEGHTKRVGQAKP